MYCKGSRRNVSKIYLILNRLEDRPAPFPGTGHVALLSMESMASGFFVFICNLYLITSKKSTCKKSRFLHSRVKFPSGYTGNEKPLAFGI